MHHGLEHNLIAWTARVSVAAYLITLGADLRRLWPRRAEQETRGHAVATGKTSQSDNGRRFVRDVWTAGCGFYLLHVAAAFHFIHDWSHAAAFEHTARRTEAVIGWFWGHGLWVNYAFVLWWPLDAFWTWRRGRDRLPGAYLIGSHLIVAFVVVNATLVFGPKWWRNPVVVLASAAAIWLGWSRFSDPAQRSSVRSRRR